jgi:hypothetical protein
MSGPLVLALGSVPCTSAQNPYVLKVVSLTDRVAATVRAHPNLWRPRGYEAALKKFQDDLQRNPSYLILETRGATFWVDPDSRLHARISAFDELVPSVLERSMAHEIVHRLQFDRGMGPLAKEREDKAWAAVQRNPPALGVGYALESDRKALKDSALLGMDSEVEPIRLGAAYAIFQAGKESLEKFLLQEEGVGAREKLSTGSSLELVVGENPRATDAWIRLRVYREQFDDQLLGRNLRRVAQREQVNVADPRAFDQWLLKVFANNVAPR